jgi:hypothetical protein
MVHGKQKCANNNPGWARCCSDCHAAVLSQQHDRLNTAMYVGIYMQLAIHDACNNASKDLTAYAVACMCNEGAGRLNKQPLL